MRPCSHFTMVLLSQGIFAISASAELITLGGDIPGSVGAIGTLPADGVLIQPFAFLLTPNHFITGTVEARNLGGSAAVLILEDLVYESDVAGPLVETIRLQQNFAHGGPGGVFEAYETDFAGDATFNTGSQAARIDKSPTPLTAMQA